MKPEEGLVDLVNWHWVYRDGNIWKVESVTNTDDVERYETYEEAILVAEDKEVV